MKSQLIYKSIFKGKRGLQENKSKKLYKIVESLRQLKSKLREEEDELAVSTATDETVEANPDAIADIIDKVEDLVVDAIDTLGATDDVTSELINTVGTLEASKEEENIVAEIEQMSQEADEIQEDFDPVYDPDGNIINVSPEDTMMGNAIIDDEYAVDEFSSMEDAGVYESFSRRRGREKRPMRKFPKNRY
jgi:hypothetical protein